MTQPPSDGPGQEALPARECPRHPGRPAYLLCAVCGRPACPDCQRTRPDGEMACVDCAHQAAGPAVPPPAVHDGGARRPAARPTGLRTPWMTYLLMALSVLAYAAQWATASRYTGFTEMFWYAGAFTSQVLMEPWRMITSAFLHSMTSPAHLLLNMAAVWMIGRVVESAIGPWRYLALYLLSALGGSVAVLWFTHPGVPVLGASGAVYGLFAALFVLTRAQGRNVVSILVLIGVNLAFSFTVPGISWQAHIGGLVAGAAVALVFSLSSRRGRKARRAPASGDRPARAPAAVGVAGEVIALAGLLVVMIALTALRASQLTAAAVFSG